MAPVDLTLSDLESSNSRSRSLDASYLVQEQSFGRHIISGNDFHFVEMYATKLS